MNVSSSSSAGVGAESAFARAEVDTFVLMMCLIAFTFAAWLCIGAYRILSMSLYAEVRYPSREFCCDVLVSARNSCGCCAEQSEYLLSKHHINT